MRTRIDADAILDLWEAGQGRYPFQRAVLALERCGWQNTLDLPLAERDRALIAIYRETFHSAFDLVAECPVCDTQLELTLGSAELEAQLPAPAPETPAALKHDVVRDVTTRDIEAVADASDPVDALRSRLAGKDNLPKARYDAMAELIDARLSEAEITLNLTCASCTENWSETLDIPEYFWFELDRTARRVLRDVAELAQAFSWSEAAILALEPHRRQVYLDLARAS